MYNHEYQYGEGAIAFYPASGGSDDWSHAKGGVPLSYTVELRDTGSYGFILPESQILPTCIENIEGIRAVYSHVRPANNCGDSNCGDNGNCVFNEDQNSMDCVCNEGFQVSVCPTCPIVTCEPTTGKLSSSTEGSESTSRDPCLQCGHASINVLSKNIIFIYLLYSVFNI